MSQNNLPPPPIENQHKQDNIGYILNDIIYHFFKANFMILIYYLNKLSLEKRKNY